ncbi:MAG: SGNH/GDSL hydrolase family protein [Candidatus Binatia bacterium]
MKYRQAILVAAIASWTYSFGCHLKDLNQDGAVRIAFVGDSTSVLFPQNEWIGYPYLVKEMMRQRYFFYDVTIHAEIGATVCAGFPYYNFHVLLTDALADQHPDAVVLAGGTNDAVRQVPVDTYMTNMYVLFTRITQANALPIAALTPRLVGPAASEYPWANGLIDQYNAQLRAQLPRTQLVDLDRVVSDVADGAHFGPGAQLSRAGVAFEELTDDALPPSVDPWALLAELAAH